VKNVLTAFAKKVKTPKNSATAIAADRLTGIAKRQLFLRKAVFYLDSKNKKN